MIDTIRRKICVDKSRSHTQGLLPYVQYDEEFSSFSYVIPSVANGNWGNYACDLAVVEASTERGNGMLSGLTFQKTPKTLWDDEGHESRMRHCDIIMRYNRIQEALRNAAYTKVVVKSYENLESKIICSPSNGYDNMNCGYSIGEHRTYDEKTLVRNFLEDKTKYEFTPWPISGFTMDENGNFRVANEMVRSSLKEGDFISLLYDYDAIEDANRWWKSWWKKWMGDENAWQQYYPDSGDPAYMFCRIVEKYFIGKVLVPEKYDGQEISGIRVPSYVYYCELGDLIEWFVKRQNREMTEQEKREWDEHGGNSFYKFLRDVQREAPWIPSSRVITQGSGFTYIAPYISFPVSLNSEHEYGGVYETYVEAASAFTMEKAGMPEFERWVTPSTYEYSVDGGRTWQMLSAATYEEALAFVNSVEGAKLGITHPEVESKLSYVMDEEATEIGGITGVWAEFSGLTNIVECIYHSSSTNTWMEFVKRLSESEAESIECGDGEVIEANTPKYRSISVLACATSFNGLTPGGHYYFMVRKNNGPLYASNGEPTIAPVTFRIPYTENSYHEMYRVSGETYVGNYVTKVKIADGECTIEYVIGGRATSVNNGKTFHAVPKTGIKYRETYPYVSGATLRTYIDGFDDIYIYYDYLDMEKMKKMVYSEEYGLYRTANIARIIGMEVGTTWTSEDAIIAPVFTREGSESFMFDPKKVLDIAFNRGAAAAFESHFKLSECNSMEDLENYGNNYYNL